MNIATTQKVEQGSGGIPPELLEQCVSSSGVTSMPFRAKTARSAAVEKSPAWPARPSRAQAFSSWTSPRMW